MMIIGDIHGCHETLKELLSRYPDETEIYSVGDIIDRGPKSEEVVQLAIDMGFKTVIGNHEHMLLDYIEKTNKYKSGTFLYNGGRETLNGCKDSKGRKRGLQGGMGRRNIVRRMRSAYEGDMPIKHLEYFKKMPFYFDTGEYLISHAGVSFGKSLEDSCRGSQPDIIWHRSSLRKVKGRTQVVGHTPIGAPQYEDHYINIDTGCVYGAYGHLTALIIDKENNRTDISIPCID